MNPNPAQIKASTQDHLDIQEIIDDLVLLKNGYCCLILQTTTINFGLLSETEQDAAIYAYASLLNSLSFPIQIYIRSQKKDVTGYIKSLIKREQVIKNPELQARISTYRRFIKYIVHANEVLDKRFYVVIPFSPLEAGLSGGSKGHAKTLSPKDRAWILEKAKNALTPKKEHVVRQLARLGLKTKQLNTQEVIKLFFSIYNAETVGQNITDTASYEAFAIQPNIKSNDNNKP